MFHISNIAFYPYTYFWPLLSSFNSHLPQKSSLLCLCIQLLDVYRVEVQNGVGGDCCSPSLGSHQPTSLGCSTKVAAFFLLSSPIPWPQEQWLVSGQTRGSLLGGTHGASLLPLCLPAVSTGLCPSVSPSGKILDPGRGTWWPVLV